MNVHARWLRPLALCLTTAVLTACGGGGGDSAQVGPGSGIGSGGGSGGGQGPGGLSCKWPTSWSSSVQSAAATGLVAPQLTADALIDAAVSTIDVQARAHDTDLRVLFNLNADGSARADGSSLLSLTWNPTHDAAILASTLGANTDLLVANGNASGTAFQPAALALWGRTEQATPYMVMGSNPFRNASLMNPAMNSFMLNAVKRLSGRAPGEPLRVTLAHMDESYWFPDESRTRAWLSANYGAGLTINPVDACDGSALATCLSAPTDLVVVSQSYNASQHDPASVANAVRGAMAAGKPVLYLHLDGDLNDLGAQLFKAMNVTYVGDNYWPNLRVTAFDPRPMMTQLPGDYASIREALARLQSGRYDFSLTEVMTTGRDQHQAYQDQFQKGASAIKAQLNALDAGNDRLFESCGRDVTKLLVLLGDKLREGISYPMTVASTPTKVFLSAYLADHAVYNARSVAPAQPNLGSFSSKKLDAVPSVTKTVNLVSRGSFRSAGVYAMPGRAVKVTRRDQQAVRTTVFVNSLRPGSTHEWEDAAYGGYGRPKFLRSQAIPIAPGETVVLTSPYGGPIQIGFDRKDQATSFVFENVGEHPYWRSSADDASFTAKLAAEAFDWVEVATDGFEVHSQLDRFKNGTLANPLWSTAPALAAAMQKHTYNHTHVLAGFSGEGIDQEPEIQGWAASRGWTVSSTDQAKHMNADLPTCGWGCSGNPYDAGWAFNPIGHGDIHELGHSLQTARFQLSHGSLSYPNHAGTNFYSYYVKSRFFDETGAEPSCQAQPFKTLFLKLQEAYAAGDRPGQFSQFMADHLSSFLAQGGDNGIYNSYAIYSQIMMAARRAGGLNNGHHIIGRVHVLERAFNAAKANVGTWDAQKAGLGFGSYTLDQAKAITNNDFMLVTLSQAAVLDLRDVFDMWGLPASAQAKSQVQAMNLPMAERAFYAMGDTQYCRGAMSTLATTVPKVFINGSNLWPLP